MTWTNAGLLSIGLLGTNFSEVRIGILSFSFKEMHLKLSSAKMAANLSTGGGGGGGGGGGSKSFLWFYDSATIKGNNGWLHHKHLRIKFNSSALKQSRRHFADDIFKCIFLNEKFCILIKISLKFVPKGHIDYKAALAYVMAWHRIGDKPLSESMLTWFTDAYICGTRRLWVNLPSTNTVISQFV